MSYAGLPADFTVADQPKPATYHGLPEGFQVQPPAAQSGIGDSIKGFLSGALSNLNPFLTDNPLNQSEADPQYHPLPTAENMQTVPGSTYQPQTTPGKFAQAAGQFAPAAVGGEGSLLARVLSRVALPSAASEGAGELASGAGPATEGAARLAGAMIGGSPAGVAAGAKGVGRLLASKLAEGLAPEDAALVQKYEQMGGHLRPGQYSPSNFMRQGDAVIADTPWPKVAGFAANDATRVLPAQQADEYNTMLARTFGETAPRITDDVIDRAGTRIGKIYEAVLPRNNVKTSPDLLGALGNVQSNIAEAAPAMNPADVGRATGTLNRVKALLESGGITGKQYQTFRMRGGILDELGGADSPVLQNAGKDIRNALDDAFIQQADPHDAAALTNAREQYRNLQVLKPLAAKAPAGNISPGLVLGAVNREFGSPGAAGELGTLARVGAAFLKAQPSSGTSERSVWRSTINKPFSEGVPAAMNKAISLPISGIVSRALNNAINSPEMRAKLLAKVLQEQSGQ